MQTILWAQMVYEPGTVVWVKIRDLRFRTRKGLIDQLTKESAMRRQAVRVVDPVDGFWLVVDGGSVTTDKG